jgi:hypothetical protein
MSSLEVSRTLVKSPPELWSELQGECLPQAVGGAQLNVTEEERRIEWEADGARGAAVLEPAGWGTKLTLTAEIEELEQAAAKVGFWARMRGAKPPPPQAAPTDELERAFEKLLDDLGSAHRKPFQQS